MLFRTLILKLAQNEALMHELNNKGIVTSLNLLGEEVSDKDEAERSAQSYISLLQAIHKNRVESNISIKLTQLGLGIHRRCVRST